MIHPQIAEVLASLPAPPPGPIVPDALRAAEAALVPRVEDRLPVASVEDVIARTPSGDVPVRVYRAPILEEPTIPEERPDPTTIPEERPGLPRLEGSPAGFETLAVARSSANVPIPEERPGLPRLEGSPAGFETLAGARSSASVGDTDARSSANVGGALVVYFHGGAFFLGSLDTHDHVARNLAAATGATVVSVDFRLAPEHAYPAGLQDCYAVVRWAAEHGDALGWDGRTLAVAGDSSGGTFAAAVAALAHDDGFDAITHQVLYYPSLDLDFDVDRYASLRENATGYGLETALLKPFNAFYVDSGADPADPLVSPIKRADLTGLPQALIVTAEHDPLRDEGELHGERLRAAGVNATVSRYAGANHGFVQNFSWIPEYHRVFDETAEFLSRAR